MWLCLLFGLLALWSSPIGVDAQTPQCICVEEVPATRGLRSVTVIRSVPDGTGRMYIGEQLGLVWIFQGGQRLPDAFLNITAQVTTGGTFDERGFLSLSFHPNYQANGRLFVYYSFKDNQDIHYSRISEWARDSLNDNMVDLTSERVVLDIQEPFASHNGGDIVFGADGYMYLFIGDGGFAGDPFNNAQNKSTMLGSALRIDVDSATLPYGIPPDNPFLSDPSALPELYAYGFRNPWRASLDPGDRTTGDGAGRIFIGDVGQNTWEEVDVLQAGGNFGWSASEGPECFDVELCGTVGPEVAPVAYYSHASMGGSASVTGGYVYRGCEFPDFNGWYFFADFMHGIFFRLIQLADTTWDWQQLTICDPTVCTGGLTSTYQNYIMTFGLDQSGELYFAASDLANANNPGSVVYKIVDPNNQQAPCVP